MKKYNIEIRVVFNGQYSIVNGNSLGKNVDDKKIKALMRDKVKTTDIMNKYVSMKYNETPDFNINLCGSCEKMLSCPKVKDKEKKDLKEYPYIKSGIEVVLVDNEKKKCFNNALKEYRDLNESFDFDIEDYPKLKEALSDNGIDVSLISVFECFDYVDDGYQEVYESRINYRKRRNELN